jgi:hypothetical protein
MSHIKICYSPSLDSFHISQSKGWGKDVDKVGSYCIFSYTDVFQDPRGKAYVQSVHSEAVPFQQGSYNHHIPRDTALYTCGSPYSRHSFWYKAWYTGTAKRPIFYVSHSETLFYLTTNVCHFLPHVGSQVSEFSTYHKQAKEGTVNASCQLK